MTISNTNTRPITHLLIFPFPSQGHMVPLLDLTYQLAKQGLTITILITPKNLPLLNPLLSTHPSIKTLILPFPQKSSIPHGIENSKDLPPDSSIVDMIHALGDLHDPLLHWFQNHPSPPDSILSDFFLGWTHKLASRIGIPRFVFSPSSALFLSVVFALWTSMPRSNNDDEIITFPNIPNSPKYPWLHLSRIYRRYVEGDPVSEFTKDGFVNNMMSSGLVINSFEELERVYLDHLAKQMAGRVWAVGPLLPMDASDRGGPSSVPVEEITSWLDTCRDREVVYVCFGSQAVLSRDQMEAVVLALEKSEVRFILSVRGHVEGDYGVGFGDRVAAAGKGTVIRGWAPQAVILKHLAVGAFLSHCGWNSVVEGLVGGAVILAWPMEADQFVNARLLVDELKVARLVCEGAQTVPDSISLARALARAVGDGEAVIKKRVLELSGAAMEAVAKGGTSVRDLAGFVAHLAKLN